MYVYMNTYHMLPVLFSSSFEEQIDIIINFIKYLYLDWIAINLHTSNNCTL